jgi:hypothetical protein
MRSGVPEELLLRIALFADLATLGGLYAAFVRTFFAGRFCLLAAAFCDGGRGNECCRKSGECQQFGDAHFPHI